MLNSVVDCYADSFFISDAFVLCSGDGESESDDEIMDVDAAKQDDIVAQALAAADALGKTPNNSGTGFLDITDGLKELDMDHYDDEDAGISIAKAPRGIVFIFIFIS